MRRARTERTSRRRWAGVLVLGSAVAVAIAGCSAGGSGGGSADTSAAAPSKVATAKAATNAEVIAAVAAAQSTKALPSSAAKELAAPSEAGPLDRSHCTKVAHPLSEDALPNSLFGGCTFGDPSSSKLMVVYGDSHSAMWGAALEPIALRLHMKLKVYSLGGCPVLGIKLYSFQKKAPNTNCDAYQAAAVPAILAQHPSVILVTNVTGAIQKADTTPVSSAEWAAGLESTLGKLKPSGAKLAVIGDIPVWSTNTPQCLAAHLSNVQECAVDASKATTPHLKSEQKAATAAGVPYIKTTQWLCAEKCEAVINNVPTYYNEYHITGTYAQYLNGALQASMASVLG